MSIASEAAAGGEDSAPTISTVAGTGDWGSGGDGGPAALAQLKGPLGIAVDHTGSLFICDSSNHRVRKVGADGKIDTVVGTGTAGFGGDGGPAAEAQLKRPAAVAVDSAGALYITDAGNQRVRKVTADGVISTVAGTGTAGFGGDGGAATAAHLNAPSGVAVDSSGVLYVAESSNHRVRKITADGVISTVVGNGSKGAGGDGGPAVEAQLNGPLGVAVDAEGSLYIVDFGNNRVRKVAADGTISTVAGTGAPGFAGDDGLATKAQLLAPVEVMADSAGALYIADAGNHRVRKVAADGTISTVAGTGTPGSAGDDGPATKAQLGMPSGLAAGGAGGFYIAESGYKRVRKVTPVKTDGPPESGTVVSWTNIRSRLRMGVLRESTKDGAEVHQALASPRAHQRWRLVVTGRDQGDVLYRIENVRSGKVLEVVGAGMADGAVVAQRAYEGDDARHQQWRLVPVDSATGAPRVYEIANRNSGLFLCVGTNAPATVKQHAVMEGDPRARQWQLLSV
ncbi:RICIN domain-containing protein [Streptomyces sp. NPDC093510]|uniref:NHL domain-containing protein n=1 Tax=Streptomyces sp. NPDC093510 TaxID=3155199 RepID=UPI00342E3BD8